MSVFTIRTSPMMNSRHLTFPERSVQEVTHVRPERPSVLDADIHVVTVKGEKFVMVVGILNGQTIRNVWRAHKRIWIQVPDQEW